MTQTKFGESRLVAQGVSVGYGDAVIIEELSLEIADRGFTALVGPNGSGKSTLVRCLCRLIDSTGGEVVVDGENVQEYDESQLIEYRRKKIAMVFQHFGNFPHKSVLDNVAYGLEVQGIGRPMIDLRFQYIQGTVCH